MLKLNITSSTTYILNKEDEAIVKQYAKENIITLTEAINRLEQEKDYNFTVCYNEQEPLYVEEKLYITQ